MRQISRMSSWTVMFHQAAAVRLGLNPTDTKCLGVLQETGPITAGEVAELTGLTTGAITGVIDRLERSGFVRRAYDPHDRRRVFIEPLENPAQAEALATIYGPLAQASLTEFIDCYNDEELALVLDFVKRGAALMKAQTARLQKEYRNDGAIAASGGS